MKIALALLLVLLAYVLASCTSTPTVGGVVVQPQAALSVPAAVVLPHMTKEWSASLMRELKTVKPQLDKASGDMARFCPQYKKLGPDQQLLAWGHLTAAILFYESGVDKKDLLKTCSSMIESNGKDSIGFFQLSYGDSYCPARKSQGDLCSPDVNIKCGVRIMAKYTARDSVVARGGYVASGNQSPLGLSRYWSVVRTPDVHARVVSGKSIKRTHQLQEIINLTKKAPGCT